MKKIAFIALVMLSPKAKIVTPNNGLNNVMSEISLQLFLIFLVSIFSREIITINKRAILPRMLPILATIRGVNSFVDPDWKIVAILENMGDRIASKRP